MRVILTMIDNLNNLEHYDGRNTQDHQIDDTRQVNGNHIICVTRGTTQTCYFFNPYWWSGCE